MTRQAAEARGRRAERLAAWWLRAKGYSIIGQRVRTAVGEIDLVARRGGALVFVEVKARATMDEAAACLTPQALARVQRAAQGLAARFATPATTIVRIDAVLVAPRRFPRHLKTITGG
jgi:putative endonuclease